MVETHLIPQSNGFSVNGELNFDTVVNLRKRGVEILRDCDNAIIDFQSVTRANSAGLALCLSWMRYARQHKKSIKFINFPPSLLDIAKASNIEELLNG